MTIVKVYGPYRQRKGSRLFPYYIEVHDNGSRRWVRAGPSEEAYVDFVHFEGDIPMDILEDLATGYAWLDSYRFARVREPLGKLLKLLGVRYHTDEEVP